MNQRPPHTTLPNQTLEQADFLHFFTAAARNGYVRIITWTTYNRPWTGRHVTSILQGTCALLVFYKEHAPPPAQSAALSSSPPNFP